jgi:hypothetical protein
MKNTGPPTMSAFGIGPAQQLNLSTSTGATDGNVAARTGPIAAPIFAKNDFGLGSS